MRCEYIKRRAGVVLLTFAASAFIAMLVSPGLKARNQQDVSISSASISRDAQDRGAQDKKSDAEQPAEQVFKNIQVLKGMPASKVRGMMNFMNAALGVNCAHCHVLREWDKDDKQPKETARKMLQMVFNINKASFGGKMEVNCYTCHKGELRPAATPVISPVGPPDKPAVETTAEATISVDQLLEKYVQALGGRAGIEKVKTRFMKGTMVSSNRPAATVEIYGKAPDKFLVVNTFDPTTLASEGFDGKVGWGGNLNVAHEIADQQLAKLKRDAEFFKAIRLKELYTNVTLARKEKIDGREAYVIEATASDGGHEKLFFDAETNLLVRRYVETETALGVVPFQFDFQDYRDVDGIKEPFLLRLSFPDSVQVRKLTEIKHNVKVQDSKFALADTKR